MDSSEFAGKSQGQSVHSDETCYGRGYGWATLNRNRL